MSSILDALRKSENERRKAEVPGIGDVPLVVHRDRAPRWTLGVIAGLSVCLAVLVWAWLREADPGAPPDAVSEVVPPAVSTPAAAPAVSPGGLRRGEIRDLSAEARRPAVNAASGGVADPPGSTPPAAALPANPGTAAVPTRTLAQFRAAGGALPELNLELHVYSTSAAERFVFINSAKYVEGETLAEGPRLNAITMEGAVLNYQGQSLLLPRE